MFLVSCIYVEANMNYNQAKIVCQVEFEFEDDFVWATLYSNIFKENHGAENDKTVETFIFSKKNISVVLDEDRMTLVGVQMNKMSMTCYLRTFYPFLGSCILFITHTGLVFHLFTFVHILVKFLFYARFLISFL